MPQLLSYSSFNPNGTNGEFSASPALTSSGSPSEYNSTKYSNKEVLKTKNSCAGTKSNVVSAQGIYKNLFGGKYTRRRKHLHRRRRHKSKRRGRSRRSRRGRSRRGRGRHGRIRRGRSRRGRKKGGQSLLNPSMINNNNSNNGMDHILNYSYGQGYGYTGNKVSLNGLGASSPTPHTPYAKCNLNVVRENL